VGARNLGPAYVIELSRSVGDFALMCRKLLAENIVAAFTLGYRSLVGFLEPPRVQYSAANYCIESSPIISLFQKKLPLQGTTFHKKGGLQMAHVL